MSYRLTNAIQAACVCFALELAIASVVLFVRWLCLRN